jgi:hypothetical protein
MLTRQVKKAPVVPNVEFRVGEAEATGLPDESADCVSVAQALHWFNLPVFYGEAHRVLRPGGVLAAWGYATCTLGVPALDDAVRVLYDGDLGAYWSPKCVVLLPLLPLLLLTACCCRQWWLRLCCVPVGVGGGGWGGGGAYRCASSLSAPVWCCVGACRRRLVDAEYAGLEPTNFRDVTRVTLPLVKPMTVRDFLGYLTTWSSYQVQLSPPSLPLTDPALLSVEPSCFSFARLYLGALPLLCLVLLAAPPPYPPPLPPLLTGLCRTGARPPREQECLTSSQTSCTLPFELQTHPLTLIPCSQ